MFLVTQDLGFTAITLELLEGFWQTLRVFALTLIFSLPLGLVVSFGSMSRFKPLKALVRCFVWIIRGTPLMLQLIIIFYGPGLLNNMLETWSWLPESLDFSFTIQAISRAFYISIPMEIPTLSRFVATIVAFSINYACYFSEIYRGGIESISKGQYEAGQVLGMTKGQIFFKVVLLQVVKRIVAPMSNEIITLVKDTSLARIISVYEIIWAGESFIKKGLLWPLFYTGAFYLIFNGLLTILFAKVEKKLNYFRG